MCYSVCFEPLSNPLLIFRWFWKGKPQDAGQEEDCCAHRPIGLHKYKMPEEIVRLDRQFFGSASDEPYKKLNAKTKKYVDKVRNAMGISSEL